MTSHNEQFWSEDSDMPLSEVIANRHRITRIGSDDFSTDISSDIIPFHRLPVRRNIILSSSESEEDESIIVNNNTNTPSTDWLNHTGNQPQLTPFVDAHGFKLLNCNYEKVEDIYSLLLDDRILEIIVEETNRYAEKILFEKTSSRLDKWKPTDKTEIKRLFGLIMWMGIVKLPEVHLYWSKDAAYAQSLPSSVLSRNRFELLLRMLHFCDNENEDQNDRLYKIRAIIDMLNENFQKYYNPGELVCVDESFIPFRGRIVFKQYIKQKRHKHGIKILKLCSAPGYTVNFQIYCGKKSDTEKTTPTNVVLSLCKNIFGKGHTLCTDNWYTSIDLARQLIARDTHLIGTMRSNRRGIPKDLVAKKLMRNEYIAKESLDGLTVLKWKDKRDVLLLSTKHSDETVVIRKMGYDCVKPKIVIDYNEGKSYVDVSDQMSSYCNPLRKSVKWYKKLVFQLFLNTAVVNAWIMHNSLTNNKISSLEFRKQLAMHMMSCKDNNSLPTVQRSKNQFSDNGNAVVSILAIVLMQIT
ncbi:PREDICTED: piggyBac transposable element-derived protein 4-like [Habropoda laboriosa]|uniref:piggyBac transposable element-derived protein 4-like n=1 Tax=Habropoda laboriosa TaxID=597456 RepID=UPI00083DB406|nr:PREDICTED: piggyBac transposable element-derived protein 4-like [Habropoda laboriosa]